MGHIFATQSGLYPHWANMPSSIVLRGPLECHSSKICCDTFNVPLVRGVNTRWLLMRIACGEIWGTPSFGFAADVSWRSGTSSPSASGSAVSKASVGLFLFGVLGVAGLWLPWVFIELLAAAAGGTLLTVGLGVGYP